MTDSVSEIAARLRAGLEAGPDFIQHTTDNFGTRRVEVYRVDGPDLRAILDENERLVREQDQSLEDEREACIGIVRERLEAIGDYGWRYNADTIADAIRARAFLNKDTPHD